MPNTTKGYPYPEDTDPADVPADVQLLAEAVDAAPGVASLTQAQIDALGVADKWAGRVVWNQTTGKLQRCDGSAWVDLVLTNDGRLTDARTPTAHAASHAAAGSDPVTLAQSQITNLTSDLAAKAPLASPTFTGNVTASTTATGSVGLYTSNGATANALSCDYNTSRTYLDVFKDLYIRLVNGSYATRMRIDPNGLISGTGISLGAYTAYTPSLSGTGWSLGNGTIDGRYSIVGKTCHFRIQIAFGSTSTFGSGALTVTLPASALVSGVITEWQVSGHGIDASAGSNHILQARRDSASTMTVWALQSAAGLIETVISNKPFTWASGDSIYIYGSYEVA